MGEGDKRGAAKAARDAAEPDVLQLPRTTTLDDPFTTSLLAEITRRSRTLDVSPEQIAEALDLPVELVDEPPTTPVAVPVDGKRAVAPASAKATRDPDDPA